MFWSCALEDESRTTFGRNRNEFLHDERRPRPWTFHGHAIFDAAFDGREQRRARHALILRIRGFERCVVAFLRNGQAHARAAVDEPAGVGHVAVHAAHVLRGRTGNGGGLTCALQEDVDLRDIAAAQHGITGVRLKHQLVVRHDACAYVVAMIDVDASGVVGEHERVWRSLGGLDLCARDHIGRCIGARDIFERDLECRARRQHHAFAKLAVPVISARGD